MVVEISGVTQCSSHGQHDLISGAWLDYPRTGPIVGDTFQVYGWVVGKAPVAEVEFIHERSVVESCELTVSRPDVTELYGSSSQVGFSRAIGTAGLAPDFTIEVSVVFHDGRRRVIAEICGTQQLTSDVPASDEDQHYPVDGSDPTDGSSDAFQRMVLVHIPKTAGSSVNAFMEDCLGERACASHIEGYPEWRFDNLPNSIFENKAFLSGHVYLFDLRNKLTLRNTLVTTVLREPIDQLISHIAWTRRLADSDKKELFYQHETAIQNIATSLAQLDLGSPVHLKKWASELSGEAQSLFDNCQVRYLTDSEPTGRVTQRDLLEAIGNLQSFDLIGRSERLPAFLTKVAEKMRLECWSDSGLNVRENVTTTKYGLDPRVREALEPLIQFDQLLYDEVASGESDA